jgi:hypothetical protein
MVIRTCSIERQPYRLGVVVGILVCTLAAVPRPALSQAHPDWRGQTSEWYLEQARAIYQQMTWELRSSPAGVAIADRDTVEVIATFTSDQLQSPKQ